MFPQKVNARGRKTSDLRVAAKAAHHRPPNTPKGFLLVLIVLGSLLLIGKLMMSEEELPPGLQLSNDGDYSLSLERQTKLDRELKEIDQAEQYALLATASKLYPCYSCLSGQKTIFLRVGEIWRIGVTRKGEQGRYPNQNYGAPDLIYIPQFWGTLSDCLKQEKLKIYHYPLLPEAMTRAIKLIRPPGNKYDS